MTRYPCHDQYPLVSVFIVDDTDTAYHNIMKYLDGYPSAVGFLRYLSDVSNPLLQVMGHKEVLCGEGASIDKWQWRRRLESTLPGWVVFDTSVPSGKPISLLWKVAIHS